MTLDILIGFQEEPIDLEGFMRQQSYSLVQKHENGFDFEREDSAWPKVSYYDSVVEPDLEEDVWGRSGFKITSELEINYPIGSANLWEEANRLSKEIVKKFNAVLYDSGLEDYFTRKDFS